MGCNFSEELVLPPPLTMRLNRVTSKNVYYIFEELSMYIKIFLRLAFAYLNCSLNKVVHKFANIQFAFDFLSVLKSRGHSNWRIKKNEYRGGGRGTMVIRTLVRSKSNK